MRCLLEIDILLPHFLDREVLSDFSVFSGNKNEGFHWFWKNPW